MALPANLGGAVLLYNPHVLLTSFGSTSEFIYFRSGSFTYSEFPRTGGILPPPSFGQENQVLKDIFAFDQLPFRFLTHDTGRLFNETYELIDTTRSRYKIDLEVFFRRPTG
jgi:3'-phosphoadenosine 5'-phosphosulfate sulfotransferase (PAPS reductase)/FAD synthetase